MTGKTKNIIKNILFTIIMVIGLGCLLYPTVSDIANTLEQQRIMSRYQNKVNSLSKVDFKEEFEKAKDYNERLYASPSPLCNPEETAGYETTLNVNHNDIMAIVSVPSINIKLPVYHGTEEAVLGNAVGHLWGSSLPLEGNNVHSVIAAHRGLTSARLFTDIDQLETGDEFTVTVLDKVYLYRIDDIRTVLPEETKYLEIFEGENYCTLQTCTPYGVNSHRLLVRGKYVKTMDVNTEEAKEYEVKDDVPTVMFNRRNIVPVIISFVTMAVFTIIKIKQKIDRKRGEKTS